MTELQRGVCVLPQWLADSKNDNNQLKTIPIGLEGMHRKLFLAMREIDLEIPYIEKFIEVGKKAINF